MGLSQSCKGPLLNYRAVKTGAVKTCFWTWKVFHGRTAPVVELFHVAGCPDGLAAWEIHHWDEIPSPTYGFLHFLSMDICCSGTHACGPTSGYWVKQTSDVLQLVLHKRPGSCIHRVMIYPGKSGTCYFSG